MHELSIALGILDVAQEEAARQGGGQVVAIHLRLGVLSGVIEEALRSAFEMARTESELPAAELVIERVGAVARCPRCAADRAIASIQRMCCPVCQTPTPEVVAGRELQVVALELEEA